MPAPFTTPVAISVPFLPQRNPDFNGLAGTITAENVQDAIEQVYNNAPGRQARFTLTLLNNSTMSNGQRFSYSELLPNVPVVVPRACRLREIAFSNNNAAADAQFRIYARTPTSSPTPSGTLLYTWNLTDVLTATLTGIDLAFAAGQEVLINFVDTGTNPSDAAMILFFVNDDI